MNQDLVNKKAVEIPQMNLKQFVNYQRKTGNGFKR